MTRLVENFSVCLTIRVFIGFAFTNKSPYHEIIDFDVHVGHFAYYDHHAKNEHINPLLEQIGKLEEALSNIRFERHWLESRSSIKQLKKWICSIQSLAES
ncbi:hypothetical protein NL676_032971 [Syzygium grande]|nr:hypothetical protein NL676_032971 [Syzygium grande]